MKNRTLFPRPFNPPAVSPRAMSSEIFAGPSPTMVTPPAAGMTREDFASIVLPLPSFLVANSNRVMLESLPVPEGDHPHPDRAKFRLCYQLNPRYFNGNDTSLDDFLFALMRGGRRGSSAVGSVLTIATELTHTTRRGLHSVWSTLVISISLGADREECLARVNKILGFLVQRGNIRPLDSYERATLGRKPFSHSRYNDLSSR